MSTSFEFILFRVRGGYPTRGYETKAKGPNGKLFSMKDLARIESQYGAVSEPKFDHSNERPMVYSFTFTFEDHMYNAFVIAEL